LPCAFIKNNLEERVGIMRARVPSRSGSRCFVVGGLMLLSLFSSSLHAQRERPGKIPPWGRVRDAKIMGPDRLVVADEQDQRVWLVDAEGRLIMTAGRAGAGPGEFRLVDRLVRLDDSTVAVLDRPNARRTSVRVRRDSLFVIGSDAWDPRAESACVLGRSLIVAQPNVERSTQLREIGPDGAERRTFARLELETPRVRCAKRCSGAKWAAARRRRPCTAGRGIRARSFDGAPTMGRRCGAANCPPSERSLCRHRMPGP
jgi:hypothetical protein